VGKLSIAHRLKQTTHEWKIHTKQQKAVIINEMEWQQKWQKHKELQDNYLHRTKIQKLYLEQHLYRQQNKKQAQNYIKTLFDTQEKIPDKNNVNNEEKKNTTTLLKNKTRYNT